MIASTGRARETSCLIGVRFKDTVSGEEYSTELMGTRFDERSNVVTGF
jgi:hypothetical protein